MSGYSVKTGLLKSLKNILVTLGLPALLYLLNGYASWMPPETATKIAPVLAMITYFVKNYLENKDNF